jgi:putative tricarboxylic transport membrane protein
MRRLDLLTGSATTVVGALAFWDASGLAMFGDSHVPGPGFFPKILAGLLTALGLALAVMSLRERDEPSNAESATDEPAEEAPTRGGRVRAFAVLVAFGVIAPLVGVVGYVPAMVLLVLVVLYGIERRRDFRSFVAALLIPVATYLLFAHAFSIPLPNGPLLPA